MMLNNTPETYTKTSWVIFLKPTLDWTKLKSIVLDTICLWPRTGDSYCEQIIPRYRIITTIIIRMGTLLVLIKFIICGVYGEQVRFSMADGSYLLGDSMVIAGLASVGAFLTLSLGFVYNYNELNDSLYMIEFLNDIKNKRNANQLSPKNSIKFGIHLNIATKYLLKQPSYFLMIAMALILIISSTVAYIQGNTTLIYLIFWSVMTVLWSHQMWQTFIGMAIIMYSFLIYIKYQFIEVNQQIETSPQYRNFNSLMNEFLNTILLKNQLKN